MKNLLLLSSFILAFCCVANADTSRHTASYFKGLAPDYLGKKISIDVSAVQANYKMDSDKYGFLVAQTFDTRNRTDGGKIFLVADKEELVGLVKKFGSKPDVERGRKGGFDINTRRLTGVLRQTENQVLFLDIAETEVPADALLKLKKAMAATKTKTPAPKGKGKSGKGKGQPGKGKK